MSRLYEEKKGKKLDKGLVPILKVIKNIEVRGVDLSEEKNNESNYFVLFVVC